MKVEKLAQKLKGFFQGREDAFAVQHSGGYQKIDKPLFSCNL